MTIILNLTGISICHYMLCQTKFNTIPSNNMALTLLLGIIINADVVLILQTDQIT